MRHTVGGYGHYRKMDMQDLLDLIEWHMNILQFIQHVLWS